MTIEGLTCLHVQQRAVLPGDPLALGQHRVLWTSDLLTFLQSPGIGADHRDREGWVIDPRAVMVVEPVAEGEVKPGILRPLIISQPGVARGGSCQGGTKLLLAARGLDLRGDAELDSARGQALALIVRA